MVTEATATLVQRRCYACPAADNAEHDALLALSED